MNQIISNINNNDFEPNSKNISYYKFLLLFSIFIIFICIIIYLFFFYNSYKKEKISKNLINNFNITTLYSKNNSSLEESYSNSPFVIGIIEIDKIDLTYPILSTTSDKLLEISPCRFYGPLPNQIGNLCIAGHNYANNTIFGKLNLLKIGDIITIYDLSGNSIDYYIYNKQEVSATDFSCTDQNTNNKRKVTLITCNTLNGNRIVYECLE